MTKKYNLAIKAKKSYDAIKLKFWLLFLAK